MLQLYVFSFRYCKFSCRLFCFCITLPKKIFLKQLLLASLDAPLFYVISPAYFFVRLNGNPAHCDYSTILRKINIQTKSKILTILNIIFLPTLIFKRSNIIHIYINAVLALHVTLFLLSSALLFFYFQFSAFYILFNSLLYVKKKIAQPSI